ncbi:MAG: HAMP domain-containing histidine kinase [Oscillospiraceae bacterium]|nr:HAMP domain-containing histidine kinase [Oscillospiraceae bacterium]
MVQRIRRGLHVRGIRNRWLRNSFLAISLGIAAVAVIFIVVLWAYYSNSIRAGLENKANTASSFFASYATTESEYLEMAAYYIADFNEKNELEVQFLTVDEGPVVYLSSYGLTSGSRPDTEDIRAALETGRIRSWSGGDAATGEWIMAVSAPILQGGQVRGILRLVTSMRPMQRQMIVLSAIVIFAALVLIFLTYLMNMAYVRSIIEPMASLTETAKRIASGYYGIQIEKEYDDEIGDLTEAINEMSAAISRNEQMKSEFISSVSHELRTPLTAINGWGETLLAGKLDNPQDYRKGMHIIVSESRRLTKMVEELLEFSRIEDGRFNLNIEMIDLQAEFEDAVYTYQEFYKKEGIALNYTMPDREFAPIPGDPERLRQVFSNLLDNAAKHGGAGKRIDTAIGEEEGYLAIVIRDYGPGIPEEELPHVREKFYKGSSKARGNGIGLAVCDEIIQRHGGRLDIHNAQDGAGCVVTVLLPRTAPVKQEAGI